MWTLLAAALLAPQSAVDRNYHCWDREDVSQPCWADIRALYAAPPIDEVAAQGTWTRRIFLLDLVGRINLGSRGHGIQAGMISIEQRGDEDPVLTYRPARDDRGAGPALVTPLPREDWAAVLAMTTGYPQTGSSGAGICIHGWDVLVEAADPAASGGPVVRRYVSTCRDLVGVALADRLTAVLVRAFPRCGQPPRGDELWFRVDWLYRCSVSGRGLP